MSKILHGLDFNLIDYKYSKSFDKSVTVKVGIMPILSYIAGKIEKIKLKSEGEIINKGKSLGTLESLNYFGVIRFSYFWKNHGNQ